ncbi:MAG: (2Fe-2S)-binding protein [Firmicutes bacterium]|nr:(2Fe-2S)-binding protein [Bacillota bacterium]
MQYRVLMRVNGRPVERETEPRTLLVHLLRDELGLTGTHVGCDTSQCGACTVLMDGRAVKSCTVLAVQADGHEIVTVEGLADSVDAALRYGGLHPLQEAFARAHGLQCGFCTPGVLMAGADLLSRNPDPSEADVREALEGNLCRCTGYENIVAAVRLAAELLRERQQAGAGRPAAHAAGGGD